MFWTNLLRTSVQTVAAAAAGSTATAAGVDSRWYARLRKPSIQPPAPAFPVVWTVLYADIAVASAAVLTVLERRARPGRRAPSAGTIRPPRPGHAPSVAARHGRGYRRALGVNLLLNAGWSWAFFARHDTAAATATAAALSLSSADLVRRAGQAEPLLGAALLPYAAWCTFATVLSARIHQLNT